jgi:cytoskeletal protein CcmA (bactofilin family)
MFNKSGGNMRTNTDAGTVNIIGTGTSIEGDVVSSGDIRIDGTLKGTVKTSGKLVIGPSGQVEGEVNCQNADISGSILGKVNVAELLALKATARLSGEIVTGKLSIEPGADFSGSCRMGGVVKEIPTQKNEKAAAREKTA